ncbi:hypothetical protein [Peribacillus frigoritolerans]|uniref:hypothetical protein n=1 Tax=Peribacillus frigoritolerans TaxID=450367 RepID=UPI000BEE4308|nr:hypothetical protein [Peribacillus frigoritolerans]MCR8872303.1 hypothetical protein [Peribacillus frigoritolerans]PEF41257.1 hypothetical protein CON84_01670 [Bacillus sp. AFS094228]
MSIKTRLKSVEGKLPKARKAAAARRKPEKDELLFMENAEYQRYCIEWLMSLYMDDPENVKYAKERVNYLLETLEPQMNPSDFDRAAYDRLIVEKLVDWMDDNEIKDIDEERWKAVFM